MVIKYENVLEDITAFNKYHNSISNTFKKQKKRATIHIPVAMSILNFRGFFFLSAIYCSNIQKIARG